MKKDSVQSKTPPPPAASGWDPLSLIGGHVNRAARLVAKTGEVRLRPLGIGVAHMPVLSLLAGGRRMAQRDLAALTHIEQPTMAQLLNRMAAAGLVRREADPADGRSQLVSLTARAVAKMPAVGAVLAEGNRRLTAGLSAADVATLRRLLGHVIANLEALDDELAAGDGVPAGPPSRRPAASR